MVDIVTLGELLIDFTECGYSKDGRRLFEQNPGGAVANVACGAAKLGLKTAFIGKVGNDMHGRFLKRTLEDYGVNTDNLMLSDEVFTTLAFVSLTAGGEREFSFARKPGADTRLEAAELSSRLLRECRMLHVGSLSMTDEPARTATLHAVREAKANGALISYDPNYRAGLWKSEAAAKEQMQRILPYADLVKLSEEEALLLTGRAGTLDAARWLLGSNASCMVITLGSRGAAVAVEDRFGTVPTFGDMPVIDTTGAGDSFWAAFLSRVLKHGGISGLSFDDAMAYARYSNAAATLCVGKRGAIPAMPEEEEVEAFLRGEKGS